MIVAVCVDDRGGMLFNRRRQSQDRLLREDLLREAAGRPLWLSPYSLRQFDAPPPENLRAEEDFLDRAGAGELCFVEDRDLEPWSGKIEAVIRYCWNRSYPAQLFFTLPLEGWTLERREEFPGSSHEKITKEVYRR